MKKLSRIFALLLSVLIIFTALPVRVCAANNKSIVLGKSAKYQNSYYRSEPIGYKLTLKADSLVTISNGNKTEIGYYVYSDKLLRCLISEDAIAAKSNETIVMAKGVYYIVFHYYEDTKNVSVKVKATPYSKIKDRKNYSRSTAAKLKAKTFETVTQTPNNNYSRWYKIVLTKKQTIHISYPLDNSVDFTLYNSTFEEPKTVTFSTKGYIVTESKQAPGTYYLKINDYYMRSYNETAYLWKDTRFKFKWY